MENSMLVFPSYLTVGFSIGCQKLVNGDNDNREYGPHCHDPADTIGPGWIELLAILSWTVLHKAEDQDAL